VTQRPLFEMSAAQYAATISEEQWQDVLVEMAGYYGWTVLMSIPDYGLAALGSLINRGKKGLISRFPLKGLLTLLAAISGWPDLTLGHTGHKRLLFIEVKAAGGTVRPNQKRVIALLQSCGQDVYVWKPADHDEANIILSNRR
jgi:VRR-NUC domain-containing protein